MPASPEFTTKVYQIVARIPRGRVTTYGRVAEAIGSIRGARMVGWALTAPPPELQLPCHRVVNRVGFLSGGWHFGHPDVMRDRLIAEDVTFVDEYQVDLARHLWLPWLDGAVESSTAADEVDDLETVAALEARGFVVAPRQDQAVALDDDQPRVDVAGDEEIGDRRAGR